MNALRFVLVSALALLCGETGYAEVLIDFNNAPLGPLSSFTQSGVNFTAVGGDLEARIGINGTPGLLGGSDPPYRELRASVLGGAKQVSVELGDFGADEDLLFLEIFDAAGNALGTTTTLSDDAMMHTLVLSHPNIASARFGARSPALGGSSVIADNFRFIPVPEPTAGALVVLVTAYGMVTRRRSPIPPDAIVFSKYPPRLASTD